MRVLTVNTGSSSIKLALYEGEHKLAAAERAGLGAAAAFTAALPGLLHEVAPAPPEAIGHRIVAPGLDWEDAHALDSAALNALHALVPQAPDHLPQALAASAATQKLFPNLPQIACSDSAFHRTLPEVARRFALPRAIYDRGLRRCGYHGLSCASVLDALARESASLPSRVIIAHLGNGCSLTAVHDGRSRATSMGYTPLGGIPMSTRSGDLDPGLLLELLRQGATADTLSHMLNHESGLLGLSGISGDMRKLLEIESQSPAAAVAIASFVQHAAQGIAAHAAALGGLELLVFTGGIGENSEVLRRRIQAELSWLPPFHARVIPADEDRMIARFTARHLQGKGMHVPLQS